MNQVFDNGGIIGITMDFGATTSYQQTDEVIDFYDDFETFTGWTTQGTGTVTQSSAQAYAGTYSAYKQTNGDPNGAYKLLTNSVSRNYTLECWIFSEGSRSVGGSDKIAIVNSSGSGYNLRIDASTIYVEVRTNWSTATTFSSASSTRINNVWYRVVFIAYTDSTFRLEVYNSTGTQIGLISQSISNTTHSGPFDRVAILGGYPYYVDNLKVSHIDTVTGNKKNSGVWNLNASYNYLKSIYAPGPQGSFLAYYPSASNNLSSYTFNSVDFGEEHSTRIIAITVGWNGGGANKLLSSATIGGVSATVIQSSTSSAAWERGCIIYASVPTGTTGTVVLNFATTITYGCVIGSFRIINSTSVSSGAFDVHSATTTTYTTSVSVTSNSYVVSSLGTGNGVANWTNTTERYSARKYNDYLEGASVSTTTAGTLDVITTGSTYGVLSTLVFS